MDSISMRFESGVGFSSGCAEFVPKKPPPFVPSCLIATWLAAGPIGMTSFVTTLPSAMTTGSVIVTA